MEYQEKYELGSIVTATRTFNRETITGEFGGFHLLDKSNPKSIVGVVHTPNGSYDVEPYSIESVISEDEKISKEIIKYLEQTVPHHHRDEVLKSKEWIAWLEKQGKQKSKKVSLWKHWKNGIAGNGDGEQIYLIKQGNTYHLSSCLSFECDYIELSELDNLMSEKQGEQKLDWNGADEAGFGNALWAIEQARSIAKDENDMGNLWYAERWLKSIKERMKGE